MRLDSLVIACVAATLLVFVGLQAPNGPEPDPVSVSDDPLREALDTALDDERHAIAFYAAVMKTHGERRPFSNIIQAERRHAAALLEQYTRLNLAVPEDRWLTHDFAVPSAFADACDAAANAEVRNVKIYEVLEEKVEDQQILAVFESLRWASAERHLPAFRRHGNGWVALDEEAFSDAQRRQRDMAVHAQSSMMSALFAELTAAIQAGGPVDAIEVCAVRAPAVAAEASRQHSVSIGRTSFKLRNPDNRAPIWAELATEERPAETLYFADRSGRMGTLAPIQLASACLQCHGTLDDLAPGVADALGRIYPTDQATGYAEGDLRGWFWVEVPASAGQDSSK